MATIKDRLVGELMQILEVDHQYVADLPAFDQERIDLIRSCGRAAGRRLGWKVRTFARDLPNGQTRVFVVVVESPREDEARIRERGHMLLREAFKGGF